MQSAALLLFLFGLLITGVLGTETRLLFFWPGAAVIGLAGLIAGLRWRLRVLFPPSDLCLVTAALFTGYIAIRSALSPVATYAHEDLYLLAGAWVAYMLTLTAASHPRWRVAVFATLLILVAGNLGVGFIHLSGQWNFHVVPDFFRAATTGRIGGFFINPNHLGAFFSMVLFLTAGLLCFGRGGAMLKMCLGFLMVAMILGIALTASRGALIGLSIGCLTFAAMALRLVWQTQRHLFWSLLSGGVIITLIAGVILWKVNEEHLRARETSSPMSDDVRMGIWEAAMTQHQQSPIIGNGARMFYDGSIQYRSESLAPYEKEALFAHNEYLQMLTDYGWVGLALLVIVLFVHLGNGFKYMRWFVQNRFLQTGRVSSNNLALTIGTLSAVIATLVHATFEFHFHVAAPVITLAVLLGHLANPGFEGNDLRAIRVPPVRVFTKVLLIFASIYLLAGPWFHGRSDYHLAKATLAAKHKDDFARLQELNAAVETDKSNAEALYQRGLALMEKLNADQRTPNHPVLKRATTDLEKAVALNPYRYLYVLALADAYDAQSKHEQALEQIHRAIELSPLHEESRMALAIHHHRLGQFQKAEAAYLWASQARAANEDNTSRWSDNYKLLLQHVELMRKSPPKQP